tara:strand:+ start:2614 stop:3453 length:840 start_codon:yes stop_codon:yes gene_type:complete
MLHLLLLILVFNAKTHSTRALRVAFFGDAGKKTRAQQIAFDSATSLRIDTFVALGDNFYPSGVTENTLPLLTKKVWSKLIDLEYKFPPIFILGNHDHLGDPFAQKHLNIHKDLFFQTTWGNLVEVIALDTTSLLQFEFWNKHGIHPGEQTEFLKRALAKPKLLPWRIVLAHHNLLSVTKHFQEKLQEKDSLRALLEASGVDLVLSGHSHCFERCVSNDTNYFVLGSSAMLDRGVHGTNTKCVARLFEHGFGTIEFTNESALFEFHSSTGYKKLLKRKET